MDIRQWSRKLTKISAITLGCRKGLRRKARKRLVKRTRADWTMSKGKAKFSGLSPCQAPDDEVLTVVMLSCILQLLVFRPRTTMIWLWSPSRSYFQWRETRKVVLGFISRVDHVQCFLCDCIPKWLVDAKVDCLSFLFFFFWWAICYNIHKTTVHPRVSEFRAWYTESKILKPSSFKSSPSNRHSSKSRLSFNSQPTSFPGLHHL